MDEAWSQSPTPGEVGASRAEACALCAQACVEKTGRTAPHMEPHDLSMSLQRKGSGRILTHTVSSEIRSAAGIGGDFFPSLYFPIF